MSKITPAMISFGSKGGKTIPLVRIAPKKRKKSKRAKNNVMRNPGPSVVGDSYITKLKYRMFEEFNASGATPHTVILRGNSIFDPENALGGEQPLGFDQLAALYDKYQVTASSIKVRALTKVGTLVPGVLTVVPVDQAGAVSGFLQGMELPYSKTKCIAYLSDGETVINNYITTASKTGLTEIDQVEELYSDVTTNPDRQWFWDISLNALDATGPINCGVIIEATYYVRFFDRKDLGRS